MNSHTSTETHPSEEPIVATLASRGIWLVGTTAVALLALYLVGIDQGAVSLFGADGHIHEFMHDARHFLGFPCH